MTPMKDFIKKNLTDGSTSMANESCVVNKVKNPAWCTIEDNSVSMIFENVNNVIKVETSLSNDCTWPSQQIDIAKNADTCSSSTLLDVHLQNTAKSNVNLNLDCTKHKFSCNVCGQDFALDIDLRNHIEEHSKNAQNALDSDLNIENRKLLNTFCCNTCGKNFALDIDLQNHLKEHNKLTQKCNFCEKKFKFNFEVNRHIKKCHEPETSQNNVNALCKCSVCKVFVNNAEFNEHMKSHKNGTERDTDVLSIKLCKLNGVWKSKSNFVYKCNFCVEKFQSEVNLIEHMTIHKHNNNLMESVDSLKTVPISSLNDIMLLVNDKTENKLKCQKCDLKFDKKENLDLHIIYCTKSSRNIWNKFLCTQNKSLFVCSVCGINFNNLHSLNIHEASSCKPLYACNFSKKTYDKKELWSKHLGNCIAHTCSHEKVQKNIVEKSFIKAQSSVQSNHSLNLDRENSQCSTLSLRKMSELLDSTTDSNQSFVEIVPSNFIANNYKISDKRVNELSSNISVGKHSDILDIVNDSEVIRPIVSCNSMGNDCGKNVQKHKNLCSNHAERISHLQDVAITNETVPQVVSPVLKFVNNCLPNIKIEKDLYPTSNVENNLNQEHLAENNETISPELYNVTPNYNISIKNERDFDIVDAANSSEPAVYTETNNVKFKQEPDHLGTTVEIIEKETVYFIIKNTTYNANSTYFTYGQPSKSIKSYECKICEKSFIDLHTLALHLSDHLECSMHECVVCDKTFDNVLLWKNHFSFHQQQIDLNLLNTSNNSNEIESNATDTSYSESIKSPQIMISSGENEKNKMLLRIKQEFYDLDVSKNSNARVKRSKTFNVQSLPHTSNSIFKSLSCTYCDKTFSKQGALTNHEKSHTTQNEKNILLRNFQVFLPPFKLNKTQLNMQIENNMFNSDSIHTINNTSKSFSCTHCDRTFSGQGQLTNHEKSHTRPNQNNQLSTNVDGILPTYEPEETQLDMQVENNMINSDSILTINNTSKSFPCTHCDRTFSGQGQLTNHEKSHTRPNQNNQLSTNVDGILPTYEPEKTQLDMQVENNMINLDSILTINNTSKSFPCTYCNRAFSGQGQLTNHEKSHTKLNQNKQLSINVDSILSMYKPEETQLDIQVENNSINSEAIQPLIRKIQNKLSSPKQFDCYYCRKRFPKQCYWTNHMRIVHKIRPMTYVKPQKSENLSQNNEFGSINFCEQSFNSPAKTKSAQDHKTNSLVSINADFYNDNNVNSKGKLSYCNICQKSFAHNAALISHMHIHSNRRPYKCRYCNRTFNMKGPFTRHKIKHEQISNVKENVQIINQSQVKMEIIEEKSNKEQQQGLNDFNNAKLIDDNLNKFTSCTKLIRKNRIWFACDVCVKKFSTPFQLILHRRLQHGNIMPYVCKICNKTYDVRHCWNRHLKSHYLRSDCITNLQNGLHTNNTKFVGNNLKNRQYRNKFKCGHCKKEYNLIYHWKKHFLLNKECRLYCKSNGPKLTSVVKDNCTKSTRFECRICKKTYSTDYNRKVHMINIHHIQVDTTNYLNSDENVEVQEPIQTLTQQKSNQRKLGHQQSFDSDFECNLCGKFYSNANNLSRHHNLAHSKDNRTSTCKICGRTFKHKYSYREHCKVKHKFLLQTDDGLKLNEIKSSGSTYQRNFGRSKNITAQYTKKQTMTSLVERKYKCDDCGQHFETNVILGQHIINNHDVKNTLKRLEEKAVNTPSGSNNNNSVKCTICFKDFKSLSYLSNHMLLHLGIKPFQCDVCNRTFRFKSNLRIHQKKHNQVSTA